MNKDYITGLIKLFSAASGLKNVKRTGWIKKGINNPESVADHIWRMSLMVSVLCPPELNKEKMLEMCIIHDLGEITIGDLIWEKGKTVLVSPDEKHSDEILALTNLFKDIDQQKYVALLKEYNEQKTPESKFLKQIDKLEMVIQALEYEKSKENKESLDEFWDNAEKYLSGQSLEPIFLELKSLRD